MALPFRRPESAPEEQRKLEAETYLNVRVDEFYADVDWEAALKQAKHVLTIYSACETSGENEAVYKGLLIEVLESLCSHLEAFSGSPVSCSRSHADGCKADLDITLNGLSSFCSNLGLALVGECSTKEAAINGDRLRWQLTSEEVASFVETADGLLGRIAGLREKLQWRPGNSTLRRAPPQLFITKLYTLQNSLHLAPKMSTAIDINELRSWLHHCETSHSDHCNQLAQSKQTFTQRPKWLIDAQRLCLVPAEAHHKYIALSYVWGPRGAGFKTKKRNLAHIQGQGSLSYGNLPGASLMAYPIRDSKSDKDIWRLPNTIRDAITFTTRIGEQFLWVDAICIVQDDEDEKREHLRNMGSIYANAIFTLVAAEGTAFSGLSGVNQGYPSTRARRPAEYTHYPTSLQREIRAHHRLLLASSWSQRGWTFQEQIFSRRLLVFSKKGVSWECHCAVWFEGIPLEVSPCRAPTDVVAQGFNASSTPNFNDYARHVEQYNARELTYPEDAVDGISGVLGVLSTVFDGGFVAGLPLMFFDQALLWSNLAPLQRRKARLEQGWSKIAPTWSWAAWMGSVEFANFARRGTGLKSLVQWSYATRMETKWRPLQVTAKTREDDGHDVPLPPFTTSSPSHLLHCYAHTASFNVLSVHAGIDVILSTGPDSGDEVGTLTACEAQPAGGRDGIEVPDALEEIQQMTCEVLAISEMIANGEEFYNVMWIEGERAREFDFARRKGVGRAKKSAFEARKGERVELVLA